MATHNARSVGARKQKGYINYKILGSLVLPEVEYAFSSFA